MSHARFGSRAVVFDRDGTTWVRACCCTVALGLLSGCYLSHRRVPIDAGPVEPEDVADAAPTDVELLPDVDMAPADGGGDAGGPTIPSECRGGYRLTEYGPFEQPHGRPAWIDGYIAWTPITGHARVAWHSRDAMTFESISLDSSMYPSHGAVLAVGDSMVTTWQHTVSARAAGVRIAVGPTRPGRPRVSYTLSPRGGRPVLAHGPNPGRVLVAYHVDGGTAIAEIDATTGAVVQPPSIISETMRVGTRVAVSSSRYYVANAIGVYEVDPANLGARLLIDGAGFGPYADVAVTNTRLIVATDGRVTSYDFEGSPVLERQIATDPRFADLNVAARGDRILVTARLPGESLILDEDLEVVLDPGPLPSNSFLAPTVTGFVACGFRRSLGSSERGAIVTYIDECE